MAELIEPRPGDQPFPDVLDELAFVIRAELHAADLFHADRRPAASCSACTWRARTAAAAAAPYLLRGPSGGDPE